LGLRCVEGIDKIIYIIYVYINYNKVELPV
jgi:hypothetical protein